MKNVSNDFFEYYVLLLFLEAVLQGIAENNPTKNQSDEEIQVT